MSTYIDATLFTRPAVNVVGASILPSTDRDTVTNPRIASLVTDLEAASNAMLATFQGPNTRLCASLAMAGAGSGERFTSLMLGISQAVGAWLGPPIYTSGYDNGAIFFMYKASTEAELDAQYLKCKARMKAWIDAGQGGNSHGYYIDHQVVGAKQGGFVGTFFIYRNTSQP
jgi:hypothetical protein